MTPTKAQLKETVSARLHVASIKAASARQAAKRARDKEDDAIAGAVTTEPHSITWYASPGLLSIEEVAGLLNSNAAAIHRAMERQRPRAIERRKREQARAKRKATPRRKGAKRERAQVAMRKAMEPTT